VEASGRPRSLALFAPGATVADVLVVDTSAVIAALAGRPRIAALRRRLGTDGDLHAPHLIDVELIHALRRLVRRGDLSEDRAEDCRSDYADLTIIRYSHQALADRMWELRKNLTAHDAAFVALSEALAVPLVTCDARLVEASGHRADVHLFA
jgi:predicted nucleic acid-binding protein